MAESLIALDAFVPQIDEDGQGIVRDRFHLREIEDHRQRARRRGGRRHCFFQLIAAVFVHLGTRHDDQHGVVADFARSCMLRPRVACPSGADGISPDGNAIPPRET